MRARITALVSAIAVLGLAPQAFADEFHVTYQGFVDGGSDAEDLFGGLVSSGDDVTATYVYDTSLGTSASTIYNNGATPAVDFPGPDVEVSGFDGGPLPIVSATFTIDGHSYSYAPDYYADVSTGYGVFDYTSDGNDVFGSSDTAFSEGGDQSQVVFGTDDLPSTNLLAKYNSTGFGVGYLNTTFDSLGNSDSLTFEFANVSAAPEPSTWALMIAGIGLAGFALRRRLGLKPVSV